MTSGEKPAPRPWPERPDRAQLSENKRVPSHVSSVALERAVAGLAPPAEAAPASVSGFDNLSDAEVMLRVRAGDDLAFDHLVAKFRRPIVHFMYRMAKNQALAEELAQEVFLRVYRSRESYSAEAKFTTWLYRIASNLAINHARDTKSERNTASLDEPDQDTGLTIDVADGRATVEQEMLKRERLAAIRKEVEALPERQRVAVLMHKYQGLDYKQIGEVLKLSESATKSLLFRAYETLRERLKDFV